MARRRTLRKGARKGTSTPSRKTARTRSRRLAAGGAETLAPDTAADITLVAMKEVARRASDNPALFEAVVRGRHDVNKALEEYGLRLSEGDARELEMSIATVHDVLQRLKTLGWGRWPIIIPFEH